MTWQGAYVKNKGPAAQTGPSKLSYLLIYGPSFLPMVYP